MGLVNQSKSKAIATSLLQDKLNSLYLLPKYKRDAFRHKAHFDSLWDLKEMALLEGKQSIEIPESWTDVLEELEQEREKIVHH